MYEFLLQGLVHYPLLAPALFVVMRSVPIIIPPIPGVVLDLLGIALFGWKFGLVLALVGAHLGSIIAFYIARYNREFVARHVAPIRALHALESQYSEKQKFWALVAVRFVTSPVFDYINYIAGLSKMPLTTFLLTTCIGIFPYAFCIYYFGEKLLRTNWLFGVFFLVGLAIGAAVFQEQVMRASSRIFFFKKKD